MIIDTVRQILERDLQRLKGEIAAYSQEEKLWLVDGNITNSAGNLCLHLIGNLKTYIGLALGGIAYERNRPLEFSSKGVSRQQLLNDLDDTIQTVHSSLSGLKEEDLDAEFPMLVFEHKTNTAFMLVHLAAHLSYHLGQVNYHRRLLDVDKSA